MRNSHATARAATTASSTTHVACPNTSERADAITTPATTPTERSTAFAIDWLRLGCTTRSAAIAAKTGSGPGTAQPASSQATIVATADFATCSHGCRRELRNAARNFMPPGCHAPLPLPGHRDRPPPTLWAVCSSHRGHIDHTRHRGHDGAGSFGCALPDGSGGRRHDARLHDDRLPSRALR